MTKLEKILFYITLIKIVLLKKFLKEEEEEKLIDISPYNPPDLYVSFFILLSNGK